ncbi:MAG: C40 family peptidase [Deltaproteobacteria bacterium]|nr:C40 family peptidase [Deltaproteobacteria bacterium]
MVNQAYFENTERQNQLKKILDEWLNTPFRHHCGVKGKGCDCIHFVARVFEEMGILSWRKGLIDSYPRDWHLHNTRERLSEGIEKELKVKKINLSELKNGDILLSHYGRAASHAAIFFGDYVYQSIAPIGVCKTPASDRAFRRQMKFAYRIMK